MIRRPPRSTRTDTLFPTRRSSDLAHDAAGDAAGPGGDAALVDDEDVLAAALAARRQRLGQVQRGREAVDAGADDDNAAAVGKRHGGLLQERRFGSSLRRAMRSRRTIGEIDRKSTRLNSSH